MDSEDEARRQRVAARANWAGWKGTLKDMPTEPDLTPTTSAEERLALLSELSVRSWALTGRSVPDYERANIPGSITRAGSR